MKNQLLGVCLIVLCVCGYSGCNSGTPSTPSKQSPAEPLITFSTPGAKPDSEAEEVKVIGTYTGICSVNSVNQAIPIYSPLGFDIFVDRIPKELPPEGVSQEQNDDPLLMKPKIDFDTKMGLLLVSPGTSNPNVLSIVKDGDTIWIESDFEKGLSSEEGFGAYTLVVIPYSDDIRKIQIRN